MVSLEKKETLATGRRFREYCSLSGLIFGRGWLGGGPFAVTKASSPLQFALKFTVHNRVLASEEKMCQIQRCRLRLNENFKKN